MELELVEVVTDDSSPIRGPRAQPQLVRYSMDQEIESRVLTLEEDMANNPGKTKAQVKYARRLWACGMVEIREGKTKSFGSARFIPRTTLCANIERAAVLLPTERSWPIVMWKDFAGKRVFDDTIDWLIQFLVTGSLFELDYISFHVWFLGQAIGFPKYQNAVMEQIMKADNSRWEADCIGEERNLSKQKLRDIVMFDLWEFSCFIENTKLYSKSELENSKPFSYMVDKVVWEALRGGTVWLDQIEEGDGDFARVVAKTHVEALKDQQPRFPPWHPLNQIKYLLPGRPQISASSSASMLVNVPNTVLQKAGSTTNEGSSKRQKVE